MGVHALDPVEPPDLSRPGAIIFHGYSRSTLRMSSNPMVPSIFIKVPDEQTLQRLLDRGLRRLVLQNALFLDS